MPWSMALRSRWVSGSRMASMIVLSSSVSWPSSSIRACFPQATARSRTTRGNLFQMLPIGCMRVFMTLACSSVVSRLSRCTVPRKEASSWEVLNCMIWFRASTSSPTRVMSLSSRPTSTRMALSETAGGARLRRLRGGGFGRRGRQRDAQRRSAGPVRPQERGLPPPPTRSAVAGERPGLEARAARAALGGAGPPSLAPRRAEGARSRPRRCGGDADACGGGGQAPRALQALQGLDQRGIIAITLALRLLDGREHAPDGVHHAQQRAGDVRVEDQLAGPQPAEQALGGVADRLQLREPQETGRALDRVHGAKCPGQRLALLRLLLQRDQVEVELGQTLVGLEKELAEDLVHGAPSDQAPGPTPTRRPARGRAAGLLGNAIDLE